MLELMVQDTELFDSKNNQFLKVKGQSLRLEHSLVSLSKWESMFKKPFLTDEQKTEYETRMYIKCMTITQNVNDLVYYAISNEDIEKVNEYIADKMTATTFYDSSTHKESQTHTSEKTITAELIYYWMIKLNIPVEFQKWHLNRLLTLIEVFKVKESKENSKMSRSEILARNKALNAQRRAKYHTKG